MENVILFWVILILSLYVVIGVSSLFTVAFFDWLRDVLRAWLGVGRP